jgi:hypothetical protein
LDSIECRSFTGWCSENCAGANSSAFGDSAMDAVSRDFVGILAYRTLVKAESNIEIAL